MDRVRVVAVLAAPVAALLAPRVVEACSSIPSLELQRPADGEAHPRTARLLFLQRGIELADLYAVNVDGEPATLVEDAMYYRTDVGSWLLARIEPPPPESATVTVTQCHWDGDPQYSSCPDGATFEPIVEYPVGPADDDAPPDAGEVALTHALGEFGGVCLGPLTVEVSIDLTGLDQSGEGDVIYIAEVRDSAGDLVFERSVWFDEPDVETTIRDYLMEAADDLAEHCVSVRAVDLSGNASVVAEACGSDDVTPSGTGSTGDGTGNGPDGDGSSGTPMPGTTGGSPTAGDDSSSAGTNGGPETDGTSGPPAADEGGVVDRGCACTAQPDAIAGWWALGLLSLIRRRRR